ncbi:TPA: zinc-dependent peptidase [Legionella feeleii]
MFHWIKNWWHGYLIKHSAITDIEWQTAFRNLSLLHRLSEREKIKLKKLAILFLHYKSLEGAGGFEITPSVRVAIALQACLPILNLGLDWYDGWVSVIIYPGAYRRENVEVDECGIVHQGVANLSGESWQNGPVILSWGDTLNHSENDGSNVVIHEFAHKLDMLNGKANGLPPLHKWMSVRQWATVFNRAYADLEVQLQQHKTIPINPYALTSPAEFFAVFSEIFFERPMVIKQHYPEVYELLRRFYRQNPLAPPEK